MDCLSIIDNNANNVEFPTLQLLVRTNLKSTVVNYILFIDSSTRDADESPGVVELPCCARRRRRVNGAGFHDGRVPARPSISQDGDRQLRPVVF